MTWTWGGENNRGEQKRKEDELNRQLNKLIDACTCKPGRALVCGAICGLVIFVVVLVITIRC